MSNPNHNHNPNFPATLRTVYRRFRDQAEDARSGVGALLQQDGIDFLGASTDWKDGFDASAFRRAVSRMLHLDRFRMVQVVGDSGSAFTAEGLRVARENILHLVKDRDHCGDSPAVLEYGYTASNYDTNWIVNDVVAQTPQLGPRTVANVVYMSIIAVESWGCEATGHVANMVLAYHDKEETAFGTDTWLSDPIMDASAGDTLVCLEGGPQAFAQATTVCVNNVPVVAITGPKMRAQPVPERFSAARMLEALRHRLDECADTRNVTRAEKETIEAEAMCFLDSQELLQAPSRRSQYELIRQSLAVLIENLERLATVQIVRVEG